MAWGAASPFAFLIPGDVDQRTGGYGYARAIMAEWRRQGTGFEYVRLPGDFPHPSADSLAQTASILAAQPAGRPLLIDGLAFGALTGKEIVQCRAPIVVLLHHPLGLETGLEEDVSRAMLAREKAGLRQAAHIVVTSAETKRTVVRQFDVPARAITIAVPGTKQGLPANRDGCPPLILSVGSIVPRKGHLDLVAALARLRDLPWRACVAGSTTAAPQTVAELRRAIGGAMLEDRIQLAGPLADDALDRLYREADIFALSSWYEGYGMAFAEALGAGLPIVGYQAGAVPDVVPAEAGILVEPGNVAALADALRALLTDRAFAGTLAAGALAAGRRLPGWMETAERIRSCLERELA